MEMKRGRKEMWVESRERRERVMEGSKVMKKEV